MNINAVVIKREQPVYLIKINPINFLIIIYCRGSVCKNANNNYGKNLKGGFTRQN